MNEKFGKVYFGILGVVTLAFGITDLIVTIGGGSFSYGILEIPNDGFRGGWGGFVVLFAGLFYLASVKSMSEIHHLSKTVMGSILLWIIAGTDIFARICESIPGGEEGPWFNPLKDWAYNPPYPPAMLLLPFSLLAIYYIRKKRKQLSKPVNSLL